MSTLWASKPPQAHDPTPLSWVTLGGALQGVLGASNEGTEQPGWAGGMSLLEEVGCGPIPGTDRGQSAGQLQQRPPMQEAQSWGERRWKTERFTPPLERLAECNPKHQAAQQYKTEMEA